MPQDRLKSWESILKSRRMYSDWHRNALPNWCYMTDGDWFEQRFKSGILTTVAYIETIGVPAPSIRNSDIDYPIWSSKESLCVEIEKKMHIPSYVVWCNEDCTKFLVKSPLRGDRREMTSQQYIIFLKNL